MSYSPQVIRQILVNAPCDAPFTPVSSPFAASFRGFNVYYLCMMTNSAILVACPRAIPTLPKLPVAPLPIRTAGTALFPLTPSSTASAIPMAPFPVELLARTTSFAFSNLLPMAARPPEPAIALFVPFLVPCAKAVCLPNASEQSPNSPCWSTSAPVSPISNPSPPPPTPPGLVFAKPSTISTPIATRRKLDLSLSHSLFQSHHSPLPSQLLLFHHIDNPPPQVSRFQLLTRWGWGRVPGYC